MSIITFKSVYPQSILHQNFITFILNHYCKVASNSPHLLFLPLPNEVNDNNQEQSDIETSGSLTYFVDYNNSTT